MSRCWNNGCNWDCGRNDSFDESINTRINDIEAQLQRQKQRQAQAQAQDQDQDQNQRSVFREIGNVRIDIDNQSIAVLILAIIGFLTGTLDGPAIQSTIDKVLATKAE